MKKFYLLLISLLMFFSLFLAGCTQEESWEKSEIFKSGSFDMIGVEDKLGFIYDGSEVTRFYPNKEQKYMWHLWGEPDELRGNLEVIATHQNSNEQVTVIDGLPLSGPHNGADAHTPSTMSLPQSGMWKFDAFVDGNLHGSVFVKVYE